MTSGKTRRDRVRLLRDEALALVRQGHEEKALRRFAELEKLDPNEPDWPRRAAECQRVLGNSRGQIEALGRAAERYMEQGLVPKAIATCKVILSIDPTHTETQRRLGALHESLAARTPVERSSKRAPAMRSPMQPGPSLSQPAPALAQPRTGLSQPAPRLSQPAPPRAPRLEDILRKRRAEAPRPAPETRPLPPAPAPSPPDPASLATTIEPVYRPNGTPSGMFRITFPEPTVPSPTVDARSRAQRALPTTPLFSELSPGSLTQLIEHARLVELEAGAVIYRKNEESDALYVVVSGTVSVLADGESRLEIVRLGEGEVFGETALVDDERRSTTAEAAERTEVLRIDRELITGLVLSEPRTLRVALRFLRERFVQALMLTSPLFTILPKGQRRVFAERFEFLQVDRDSLLVEQGSPSPGLYVLLCGTATVTRRENERDHTLSVLNAGAVFGEMSLLTGEPAMADVRSQSKAFALRLPEWG
ncbi:MAG TPA: cyclic nucleotide-binding domain-containing protein, partial [Polyangiaceae bacterium]